MVSMLEIVAKRKEGVRAGSVGQGKWWRKRQDRSHRSRPSRMIRQVACRRRRAGGSPYVCLVTRKRVLLSVERVSF